MFYSILYQGCDINKKESQGQTPLLSAASLGYTDIFKLLLGKSEDMNAVDSKVSVVKFLFLFTLNRRLL